MVSIKIFQTKQEMGEAAAKMAAKILQHVLQLKKKACFVAATGTSQFEFLDALCKYDEINWKKTEMFHLDEYLGLPANHPASFRNYLKKRLVDKVKPGKVFFIQGDTSNPKNECKRISNLISKRCIDLTFVGIGENGHLAFNDPPADFKTKEPYIVVNLDTKCRIQQLNERWFENIENVPKRAITMSINEIMRAKNIICICPDKRKAEAVRNCLSDKAKISPKNPASILKNHPRVMCYLDKFSSSLL
ncbi:MAG: glucosamine-6-phosphate deaminase [Candidatus Odinarchaeota archaeon]